MMMMIDDDRRMAGPFRHFYIRVLKGPAPTSAEMAERGILFLWLSLLCVLTSGFDPTSRSIIPSNLRRNPATSHRLPSKFHGPFALPSPASSSSATRRCRLSRLAAVDGYSGTVVDRVISLLSRILTRSPRPSTLPKNPLVPPYNVSWTSPKRGWHSLRVLPLKHRWIRYYSQAESWLRQQTIGGVLPKAEVKALLLEVRQCPSAPLHIHHSCLVPLCNNTSLSSFLSPSPPRRPLSSTATNSFGPLRSRSGMTSGLRSTDISGRRSVHLMASCVKTLPR